MSKPSFVKIPLGFSQKFAVVDRKDAKRVRTYKWHLDSKGYVVHIHGKERIWIFLHQFILGRPLSKADIDHINGNPLDNRCINLRFASRRENNLNRTVSSRNTSGIIGVNWEGGRTKKWRASSWNFGKHITLGFFATKEKAIAARKQFERTTGHIFRGIK